MEISKPALRIDLNDFKLHLQLRNRNPLTFHFNSPSRRFYLSLIALVVNEMKKSGKIKTISLQEHLDTLVLLNESIGGAAGSSEKENLLTRIYLKWKNALPNLEEAPLFKVLGKKKEEGDGSIGKIYSFTDEEKDGWANLFDYIGSDENIRLRFAVDKIGITLAETLIRFGDWRNGEAWEKFVSSLKGAKQGSAAEEIKEGSEPLEENSISTPSGPPVSDSPAITRPSPEERKISWILRYRWAVLAAVIVLVAGVTWKIYSRTARTEVASVERMKYPLPDRPSIAVMPFINMSKDPDQEYFSDGITEDLITDLSKISGLMVIARNSTFTYKGKPVQIKQVAEDLGVRYVLEGSVRKSGDEVRINVQLIDAMTGVHLWAERYDGTMGKIFALQDQVTQKVASALAVKLTGAEKGLLTEKGTNNVEAYDAFLRGWVHHLRFTPDDTVKAVRSFKKAIELDPNYSRAYAALALTNLTATMFGGMISGLEAEGVSYLEARLGAVQYLKEAMKNPTSIAHQVKGTFHLMRRQYDEALSNCQRAVVLDPNNPACLDRLGAVLEYGGKPKESLEFFNRAIRLDPHNPTLYLHHLGIAQFMMGNLEEAAATQENVRRLSPETWTGAPWMACIYALVGRQEDARLALEKGGGYGFTLPARMYVYSFKDRAVADRFAEGLIRAGLKREPYFPTFKENQLNGEEIKKLFYGAKTSGYYILNRGRDKPRWRMNCNPNGEFTWQGEGPIPSDTGKTRIEGNTICIQHQKKFGGIEYCSTVFRNPGGTYAGKNEYVFCTDWGLSPFSVER